MKYIKKYKYLILIIILLIIVLSFKKDDDIVENNLSLNIDSKETIEKETNKIKVDIKGAVKNPGVYEIDSDKRVSDIINLSGGLNLNADTSTINLSKNLKDEMVIIIYTQEEINSFKQGDKEIKVVEKECFCPKLENDVCIENNLKETNYKISLNNASKEELMKLDGIGEKKAEDIIEYRNKNNGFKSIEELKEVKGIGDATFNKIKDQLGL